MLSLLLLLFITLYLLLLCKQESFQQEVLACFQFHLQWNLSNFFQFRLQWKLLHCFQCHYGGTFQSHHCRTLIIILKGSLIMVLKSSKSSLFDVNIIKLFRVYQSQMFCCITLVDNNNTYLVNFSLHFVFLIKQEIATNLCLKFVKMLQVCKTPINLNPKYNN